MKNANAAVVGAGPAGLGAALALSRAGIAVDVFESQHEIGAQRRGETIRFSPEMEALLGRGFFESQTIHRVNKRRYYSHSGKKFVDRTISQCNLIIEWQDFIKAIADKVKDSGADIHAGTKIDEVIFEGGRATGVRLKDRDIPADAVFSCGGTGDPAGVQLGIKRGKMDRPAAKWLITNYGGPEDRLEYHFHAQGNRLAVGCIFPRGKGEAEVIILGMSGASLPEFDEFCLSHKVFAERMKGVKTGYSLKTVIPMGGMITECTPLSGLFMSGDALGHVQARGGSGIRTSFLISYACGVAAANALKFGGLDNVSSTVKNNHHLKELRKHNLIYSKARQTLFKPAGTPSSMDMLWPLLSAGLR